jgi:hypothetical protein
VGLTTLNFNHFSHIVVQFKERVDQTVIVILRLSRQNLTPKCLYLLVLKRVSVLLFSHLGLYLLKFLLVKHLR